MTTELTERPSCWWQGNDVGNIWSSEKRKIKFDM